MADPLRERAAGAPTVGRYTVERLMADLGLAGAVRGNMKRTTIGDPRISKPADLVARNFQKLAPNQ